MDPALDRQSIYALAIALQDSRAFDALLNGFVAAGLPEDAAEDAAESLHSFLVRTAGLNAAPVTEALRTAA